MNASILRLVVAAALFLSRQRAQANPSQREELSLEAEVQKALSQQNEADEDLDSDPYARVDVIANSSNDVLELTELVEKHGGTDVDCKWHMCGALVPVSKIDSLRAEHLVRGVIEPFSQTNNRNRPPRPLPPVSDPKSPGSGSVGEEAPISINAVKARKKFGVDGSGVKVCIFSDSFDCLGGYARDIETGDLPPDVEIILDDRCGVTPLPADEGRAMAQLVHDVAPGAKLAFISSGLTLTNFTIRAASVVENSCDLVINDTLFPFGETWFQGDMLSQTIEKTVEAGIPWFVSAGNDDRNSYAAPFNPVEFPNGTIYHNFATEAGETQLVHTMLLTTGRFYLEIQWDQPSATADENAPPLSNVEADFLLGGGTIPLTSFASDGLPVVGRIFPPFGQFPDELFPTDFGIQIRVTEGPAPQNIKWVMRDLVEDRPRRIPFANADPPATAGTSRGNFGLESATSICAVDYINTPPFGTKPAVVQNFSSAGGVLETLDAQGNRIDPPNVRKNPNVCASDTIPTTFFGRNSTDRGNFLFRGTSAAVSVAGGLGALVLEKNPRLSPNQLEQVLERSAGDMDDPFTPEFDKGFDFKTGFGFVNAFKAVKLAGSVKRPNNPKYYVVQGDDAGAGGSGGVRKKRGRKKRSKAGKMTRKRRGKKPLLTRSNAPSLY